ncbi:MAG: hypothetical protein AAFV43_02480 [Planctomycetota bacterium]
MPATVLRLTTDTPVAAPLGDDVLRGPAPTSAAATRQAVLAALAAPVEFPALELSLTPDDHVAIALDGSTPGAETIVDTLVERLVDYGIGPKRIAVVTDDPRAAQRLREAEEDRGVIVETHDPSDEEQLCFAGLTKAERTLRVNRTLFEADVVLPITTEHPGDHAEDGPFDGLFPRFFDRETIDRMTRVRTLTSARARGGDYASARRNETDEAGWMLGAAIQTRVIPGRDGAAETVVFGEARAVYRDAHATAKRVWQSAAPDPAPLVIARLDGDATTQTWSDLARALATADQLVASDGAVVLWTDFDQPIGPALSQLGDCDNYDHAASELAEETGDEALFAWRLAQALERGPVFWRSRLPRTTIDDLGVGVLEDESQLLRLAERFGTCILLEQPQHVRLDASDPGDGLNLPEEDVE